MKKIFSLFVLLSAAISSQANQALGGEITWTCQGNNQYVFQLNAFYDCSQNTSIPTTDTIFWANGTIVCTLVDSVSITETCYLPAGSCSTVGPIIPVKKYIYQSTAMQLANVIPAGGYTFTAELGNRIAADNLAGANTILLRAKMYPYTENGSQVSAINCYDNAPTFYEAPKYLCTQSLQQIDLILGGDKDVHDSIFYDFAPPLSGTTAMPDTVNFDSTFTYTNPLPDSNYNSINSAPIIFSNGRVQFVNGTPGRYARCYKVESWRNGQKIAEVFQDFEYNIAVDSMITGICGSVSNLNPNVSYTSIGGYPLVQPKLGGYFVEAYAGDTIRFNINAFDYDLQPTCAPQAITATAAGTMMQNLGSACGNAPCAELISKNQNGSFTTQQQNNVEFIWPTDTNHVPNGTRAAYWFVVKFNDNHCYINGNNAVAIKVVIKKPIYASAAELNLCNGDTATTTISGDTTNLSWWPTTGISCTNCASPKFYPSATTTYTVTDLNNAYAQEVVVNVGNNTTKPLITPGGAGILVSNASSFDTVVYYQNGGELFPLQSTSYATFLSGNYFVEGLISNCPTYSDTVRLDYNTNLEANTDSTGMNTGYVSQNMTYGVTFRLTQEQQYFVDGFYMNAHASNASPTALANMECKIYDGGPNNIVFTSDSVVRINNDIIKFYGEATLVGNHDYLIGFYTDTNVNVQLYEPTKWPVIAGNQRVFVYNATQVGGNNYPNVSADAYPYFNVSLAYGIGQEEFALERINVYPNPASKTLMLQTANVGYYALFSSTGMQVAQGKVYKETNIDVSKLAAGIYILQVTTNNGNVVRQKVVIQR